MCFSNLDDNCMWEIAPTSIYHMSDTNIHLFCMMSMVVRILQHIFNIGKTRPSHVSPRLEFVSMHKENGVANSSKHVKASTKF